MPKISKLFKKEAREELRKWAVRWSGGCEIQEGADKRGWPCGTCFNHLLGTLIDDKKAEYDKHNEQVDRINEVWRFILQLRDEKY